MVEHTSSTISRQHEALRIASHTLDLHVLAITDAFEVFAANARRQLGKQSLLLAAVDSNLEAIGKTKIHSEFLSATVRKAIETGESKNRTLGDYVSTAKMIQVTIGSQKVHGESNTWMGIFAGAALARSELTIILIQLNCRRDLMKHKRR